jgi:hypothetical protein
LKNFLLNLSQQERTLKMWCDSQVAGQEGLEQSMLLLSLMSSRRTMAAGWVLVCHTHTLRHAHLISICILQLTTQDSNQLVIAILQA